MSGAHSVAPYPTVMGKPMLIMLFLLVLFMSLIQQIFIFISTIYTELSYRTKV